MAQDVTCCVCTLADRWSHSSFGHSGIVSFSIALVTVAKDRRGDIHSLSGLECIQIMEELFRSLAVDEFVRKNKFIAGSDSQCIEPWSIPWMEPRYGAAIVKRLA